MASSSSWSVLPESWSCYHKLPKTDTSTHLSCAPCLWCQSPTWGPPGLGGHVHRDQAPCCLTLPPLPPLSKLCNQHWSQNTVCALLRFLLSLDCQKLCSQHKASNTVCVILWFLRKYNCESFAVNNKQDWRIQPKPGRTQSAATTPTDLLVSVCLSASLSLSPPLLSLSLSLSIPLSFFPILPLSEHVFSEFMFILCIFIHHVCPLDADVSGFTL